MIAEAIKRAFPKASAVAVDISTCRFSDLSKGLRYVYLTPRTAQDAIVDFDEGLLPQPFKVKLRAPHVSRAGQGSPRTARRNAKRKIQRAAAKALPRRAALHPHDRGEVPDRVGGRRPPQLHTRREFGIRAFRGKSLSRLAAEQAMADGPGDPAEKA